MNYQHVSAIAFTCILLSACSVVAPFKVFKSETKERSKNPENATEYVCEGNKRFFIRMLNNGNDAWLIFPDHEVNLAKSSTEKNRYTSGSITLALEGDQTTLTDGDVLSYTACKAQAKPKD